MSQYCLALLATFLVQLVLQVLCAPSGGGMDGHMPYPAMSCEEANSTCPDGFCCVKKVITYADVSKFAIGVMQCQQLRKQYQFCLVNTENYMCPCQPGLYCRTEVKENFGTCESLD